jgi:large subunit ribosomal protein L10
MAHVSQFKKDVVKEFVKLIEEYPIIGAVNMQNLPASAVQTMRAKLRDQAFIKMSKRRLIKIAFEEAEKVKPGIGKLKEKLLGMPALLFTKENPFTLYKIIKKNKSPAPAKGGQTAPKDILVKAGPTSFMPGPIIGELGSIGIKTGVENGKLAIKEDAVVVKEGEEISAKAAELLTRLEIKPMEIGLDLIAVYEDGVIYDRKVLDIDEDKFMSDLTQAAVYSRNLAMEICYPTKDTIADLIVKAHMQSKALGREAEIVVPGMMPELLSKAQSQATGLKNVAKFE